MKKVKFDNSLSLELAFAGRRMPPILILEGWLVDDHVCIQQPNLEIGSDWRVSLYPWGHVLTFDFYTRADATDSGRHHAIASSPRQARESPARVPGDPKE